MLLLSAVCHPVVFDGKVALPWLPRARSAAIQRASRHRSAVQASLAALKGTDQSGARRLLVVASKRARFPTLMIEGINAAVGAQPGRSG